MGVGPPGPNGLPVSKKAVPKVIYPKGINVFVALANATTQHHKMEAHFVLEFQSK